MTGNHKKEKILRDDEDKLKEEVRRYREISEKALAKVSIKLDNKDKDYEKAKDLIEMAKNYFEDAKYFENKGMMIKALAAYSYAYAWLDVGVRLKLLDGKNDDKLFILP